MDRDIAIAPSLKVFIAGVSGSGKSYTARTQYMRHFRRQIYVDFTGEYDGDAQQTVQTVAELADYIRANWARGAWSVSINPDDDDLDELVAYLIPMPRLERAPTRLTGGAVMLFDEADVWAGPGASRRLGIRTIWRRARHCSLSVVATTQRPANVSKEVTSQSNHILCLQLADPDDLDYMERFVGCRLRAEYDAWIAKYPHGGLWHDRRNRVTRWYDGRRFLAATVPSAARRRAGAGAAGSPPAGEAVEGEEEEGHATLE